MTSLLSQLDARIKSLAEDWPKYTVIGSFVLYLTGYLAVRFHLTAMGLAIDLAVLDERYLFTGARFFVYLVSVVPVIVMVALVFWPLGWGFDRALPRTWRTRVRGWPLPPRTLALLGVVCCVFTIQFAMRQCFLLHDLLLAERLPAEPAWLCRLLFDDGLRWLYFNALASSCLLSLAILWSLFQDKEPTPGLRRTRALLVFLAGVQVLFLPINFGVLTVDKSLARVVAAGSRVLTPGETAWLVWQGKDATAYLVRSADGRRRTLVAQPNTPAPTIEVLAVESIIPALFDSSGTVRLPPWDKTTSENRK